MLANGTSVEALPAAEIIDLGDVRTASARVLESAGKAADGWIGRTVNRRFSRAVSRVLLDWDVRPNTVTLANAVLACIMTVCLWQGGVAGLAIGGALYQLVSMADGIDGEIARMTHRSSRSGAMLDTATDMLANLGFVVGVIVGVDKTYGGIGRTMAMVITGSMVGAIVLMVVLTRMGPGLGSFDVLRHAMKSRLGERTWFARLVMQIETLFRRDAYVLIFASLCVAGLAWLVPPLLALGSVMWLLAIIWCAPLIVGDREGRLLPDHLRVMGSGK